MDIGLSCDVCGRVVQGITYVNGMKFCAKCYQETFGSGQSYKTVERMWGDMYIELLKEHRELEQENKTLQKALELACGEYSDNSEYCCEADCKCNGFKKCSECLRNKFIDQAKKEINND